MRILVAPDKFAGTLSAVEAAAAIAEGWRRTAPSDELVEVPLADGGPGFVDVLHATLGVRIGTAAEQEQRQRRGCGLDEGLGRHTPIMSRVSRALTADR